MSELTAAQSRRRVLTGALTAAGAWLLGQASRPLASRAASGDPATIGVLNTATSNTAFEDNDASETTLSGIAGSGGIGVYGAASGGTGVRGADESGIGLSGHSTTGVGVYGDSTSMAIQGQSANVGVQGEGGSAGLVGWSKGNGIGVGGYSNDGSGSIVPFTANCGVNGFANQDSSAIGVKGQSNNGTGVFGLSVTGSGVIGQSEFGATGIFGASTTSATLPAPTAKVGVQGISDIDTAARGVLGSSKPGFGVYGLSQTGRGVYGSATTGQGVRGAATTGTAGYFATSSAKAGVALQTVGKVRFGNSVGIATILSGTKSVVVTPGIDLTSSSAVVATLQGSAGGTTTVQRVAVDATADTFTIYLTANTTANVKVAWHVFG